MSLCRKISCKARISFRQCRRVGRDSGGERTWVFVRIKYSASPHSDGQWGILQDDYSVTAAF